jgi:hypothetical protein
MANGNDIQIEPRAGAAGAPTPAPSASSQAQVPQPAGQAALPDELLNQPVMQALMAGSPAAVSASIEAAQQTEFGQMVSQFGPQMQQAGFGFYRSQSGDLGVVFNQLFLPPEEIQKADQAGTLIEIAPPLDQVEQAILGDPNANPVLQAQTPGAPPMPGQGGAAPQAGAPPRATPSRVTTQRKQNLTAGSPTSGARPGAGRLLNEILKPVV